MTMSKGKKRVLKDEELWKPSSMKALHRGSRQEIQRTNGVIANTRDIRLVAHKDDLSTQRISRENSQATVNCSSISQKATLKHLHHKQPLKHKQNQFQTTHRTLTRMTLALPQKITTSLKSTHQDGQSDKTNTKEPSMRGNFKGKHGAATLH
jgi:hypothetical protein